MSDAAPPPWVKLTSDNAYRFTVATIEARRWTDPPRFDLRAARWNEVEAARTLGVSLGLGGLYLDTDAPDGLLVDGPWEVRLVSRRLHRDACAFVA